MEMAVGSSFSLPVRYHPSQRSSSCCFYRQNPILLAKFTSPVVAHPTSTLLSRPLPCFPLSFRSTHRQLSNSSFTTSKPRCRRRRGKPISDIVERFTERAIKAVFSQREALSLGKHTIFPQHLFLGLIADDRSSNGYLGFGLTVAQARSVVCSIWKDEDDGGSDGTSTTTNSAAPPMSATDIHF